MYSRPLKTPAEEAEIARKLLTDRSEAILERLARNEQSTVMDDANRDAVRQGVFQGRPVALTEKVRELQRIGELQRDEWDLKLKEELVRIDAFQREGNTDGLTGAQMAREAMNAVERVEVRGAHVTRPTLTAEFNVQGEKTRGLDPKRIEIELEAARDDPDVRASRQADADGPLKKFNEQAQSSALERHKAEQASLIAYVYGTRGPTPDNSQKTELAQEQGSALDRHKAEQAKIIAQSTETKTPDNCIKVEIGRDDQGQDLER